LLVSVMAHVVSCRSVIAEAWARSQASPCRICGGQISTGTEIYRRTWVWTS